MSADYYKTLKQKNIILLREMLSELPPFVSFFFTGVSDTTAPRTKIAYATDFKVFFNYITTCCPEFKNLTPRQLTLDHLQQINRKHIEDYMEYLSYYTKEQNGKTVGLQNDECGKSRKLASVRKMFSYFFKSDRIPSNPADKVDFPKLHKKSIIRLDVNEVANLLDKVENGDALTPHQQSYHKLTMKRDLAIISLLLGTGMRVSECVGINIEHLDFDINGVKVTRKGGDEAILYFNDEVYGALLNYLDERENIEPKAGHEGALFLSLQNKRITIRAVQLLVKKYSKAVTKLKKISPHKLRSTYGTNLYNETGDIYLVADALGHSDVNTTRKHYAHMEDERRRQAAKHIVLRYDD